MDQLNFLLQNATSKQDVRRIAILIGNNPALFGALIDRVFSDDIRKASKAAWAMSDCVEIYPDLLLKHMRRLGEGLTSEVPVAVKRNIVRVLQYYDLDEQTAGPVAQACFHFLNNASETVAVKAFSMTVLYNLTLKYPDLGRELRETLHSIIPNGSPGIRSRAGRILKLLDH